MKVAIFAASLPEPGRKLGGVEVAVHRLANELAKSDQDEITVFSLCPCPENAIYHHKQLFPNHPLLRTKIGVWFILPFLLNLVDFSQFDVIHLHGDDWFYFRRPAASVRTLHGSALNEARTATSLKRKLMQFIIYPLEHLSARLATISLAIGKDTAKIYNLMHCVDNGVDLDRFYPGPKTSEPTVFFVGTWKGRKRGEFIFNQFIQHVVPHLPEAKLWMAIDHCPEHPNVINWKFPDDITLSELFRSAWVFAYPSVYEGFGIPYIEALASGTAILTSPNTGAEYIMEHGTYGVIADDSTFGCHLLELLLNSEQRLNLARKGLLRAQDFAWSAVADKHWKLYRDAILSNS
jgi:phosphatidylinositol alpha-mannosyltransferase